ncbi:MAG: NAD(P)/FAD-dependent oxidoreductase [Rubrivivax sp.]|nr:NAD(P)/FAD-dependent oxidoreductase [Pyrinomonadaceae bacterium]
MEQFDVVVVGAGLAGLQTTRLLARRGVRVLLVDRKRTLEDSVHTTGIFVRRTLEDFDLPDDCLGQPIRRVTLYSPARRALKIESEHDEFRVGRMGRLYARLLEDALDAGAEWSPATRYVGLETAGHRGSQVLLERGGLMRRVAARFLIGGDGARSRVARDLGLDENREWIVGVEDVLEGARLEGPPQFHCFIDPRIAPGYLAWVVHDDEETHVGVGGYAARFDAVRALEDFRAEMNVRFDFSRARRIERRGGRIPVGGVLRKIANARGLLVGDAAGAVSPLTAGGLDPCMRLSNLAAAVVADCVASGDESSLARYSGERFRARFVSRLWMRRLISSVRSPLLLETACSLMRLPPFDALARHVFFGRGSFPDCGMRNADFGPKISCDSAVAPVD